MPQIPVATNRAQLGSLPQVGVARVQDTTGESLGGALREASDTVHRIQIEERNKADRAAVTEAHARLNSWVNGALYTNEDAALKQRGKNAFDLGGRVLPEYQKQVDEISNTLTSDRQKQAFGVAATDFRSQVERQLGSYELQQRDEFYDDMDQASRSLSGERAALSYTDPLVLQQSRRDILASVRNEGKRKGWDDATIANKSFDAFDKFNNSVIDGMLAAGDLPTASAYFNDHFTQMTSANAESVQRKLLSAESQALSINERNKKIAGDTATKEGDNLLANGGLSASWIEENRGVLSPEDYRYFYKALSGGEAPRNPDIYAGLREQAGLGFDVRDKARNSLRRGQIDLDGYNRIVSEVESSRPGWYRNGVTHLSTVSGYSELNPTPGAAQLKATMLDEWMQWAEQNKDATPDQARKMYLAISDSHMLADKAIKILTLPIPTKAVGSRDNLDINATELSTVEAFRTGQIDAAEFERQAKIIAEWRKLYGQENDRPKQ